MTCSMITRLSSTTIRSTTNWVSGSIETKTYGKTVALRAHEEQHTLPRRSIFGKDIDARSRVFNALQVLVSPTEALFSGKWACPTITGRCRASL
jgi:hypothetical protein